VKKRAEHVHARAVAGLLARGTAIAVFAGIVATLAWTLELAAVGAAALPATRATIAPADTIVTHARVYTVDRTHPWAEAVAVSGGNLVAVGTEQEIAAYRGPATKVIDARGRLVLPGFADTHVHFLSGSTALTQVPLAGTKSVAEVLERVKKYAGEHPGSGWVLGRGWDYSIFGPAALPNRKDLDAVLPDRPALLTAYDGHTTWANSKALEMAGITRDTQDPPNGKIVRDANGEATGALKEAGSRLVRKLIPAPTRDDNRAALRRGFAEANRFGVVRVHSCGGDFDSFDLYDELRRGGDLTVRFYISYFLDPPELTPEEIEKVEAARKQYTGPWLSAGAVKTMIDGVIESHTAFMLSPYSDDSNLIGKPFWDPVKYKAAIAELDRRKFQIFTHAIGEGGVRLVLDAYRDAATANGARDSRHRIEHIETISAVDIPRFGSQGVVASMQPLHSYPDADTLDVWARNAGPERVTRAWPWRTILADGGRLAYGSDWPVVTISPWPGLQTAVTRQTHEGTPAGGWQPNLAITIQQAVEAYTLGAAYAGHFEKTEGSLETGKVADLIIVSQDIFKIDPHALDKTEVLLTMVGGKVVYKSAALNPEK